MNKQHPHQQIYVYVARYPFETTDNFIPQARRDEIDNCGDRDVANSKYYAFKLLELALKEVYNVGLSESKLVRAANGKWTSSVCELSISHSNDIVAVAVSDLPVGVDVERINPARFDDRLQMRIFTQAERLYANAMTDDERRLYANRIWTIKESEFKRQGGASFVASTIESASVVSDVKRLVSNGAKYYITAVGENGIDISCIAINVEIDRNDQ